MKMEKKTNSRNIDFQQFEDAVSKIFDEAIEQARKKAYGSKVLEEVFMYDAISSTYKELSGNVAIAKMYDKKKRIYLGIIDSVKENLGRMYVHDWYKVSPKWNEPEYYHLADSSQDDDEEFNEYFEPF